MLIDNLITRFPNGVTNHSTASLFASLKEPDQSLFIRDFDDFVDYLVTDWSTGGVGAGTTAVQAGLGGLLRLTTTAGAADNRWIQRNNPNFQLVAGKKLFFSCRIAQTDDATNGVFVAGLQIAVAANNFLTPANGIFFRKNAAATAIEFVSRAAGVETSSGLVPNPFAAIAAATPYRFMFYYDGGFDFWGGIDGIPIARITPVALPAVLMGPTIGLQAGTAAIRNMDIDQIFVLQER